MARIRTNYGFGALMIEGGILPPDYLQKIALLKASNQSGQDYGLSKSLALKEEISRYWKIASDLHERYGGYQSHRNSNGNSAMVNGFSIPFLRDVLGYCDLVSTSSIELGERVFKLTHKAYGGVVPVLLVPNGFDLDKAYPELGHDGRRQAPHGIMQEYLNAEDLALWGIISNGSKLRILRDNVSLTRPSFIDADLDLIFSEELYPDFSALWLTTHASRLRPLDDKPSRCIIEAWRTEAHEIGSRIREDLRVGVSESLRQLGSGFLQHPDNGRLRQALHGGTLTSESYFQQLLRLIYRLLFLFTAEDRNLLHTPEATKEQREVVQNGYSLNQLRERALRRRYYNQHQDLWLGLQATFSALARGCIGLGLPALGGLFRSDQCSDLDHASIANEDLLKAIKSISFFRKKQTLTRINYRDMGTEELGSVYESLLELQPFIYAENWTFSFTGDGSEKVKGSKRKLTGSYYTPPSLVNELIKSTLEPVISETVKARPQDPRAAILSLNVLDPSCGSGHFLLAAAHRLTTEIARIEFGTISPDETERQQILREVVQHCIYGVDHNPLAVELCKAALWIETVEPGKPLTFLDSHIVHGDSLVGIFDPAILEEGIPDKAYTVLTDDNKTVCEDLKERNRKPDQYDLFDEEATLEVAATSNYLDAMPEDTLDDIERKSAAWEASRDEEYWAKERLRSNLFVGAFFSPKTRATSNLVPHTNDLARLENNTSLRSGTIEYVEELAIKHSFLHWHLAFAEIMVNGGFHCVLGNPPWERIKLQEKEFFSARSSEIASAPNSAKRNLLIQKLNREDATISEKTLYAEFRIAKHHSDVLSQFARTGGRFPLTGVGDLNTYPLFSELFLQLVHPHGRAGLIVPTGIATDDNTKTFFNHLIGRKRLVSLYDFENRDRIFNNVHRSYKFCLLTLSGRKKPIPRAEFAFFLHQTEQLKERYRRMQMSVDDLQLFNPNTLTCPIFRTQRDMNIARKMYKHGVLWREAKGTDEEKNPWGISRFVRMFDMSNDSNLFRTREDLENEGWELDGNIFARNNERYLPLYEAKFFHQYDHRFATYEGGAKPKIRDLTPDEKSNPHKVVMPRYWVPEIEVEHKLRSAGLRGAGSREPGAGSREPFVGRTQRPRALLAFRQITRATDERTIIASTIPTVGLGHSGAIITLGSLLLGKSQEQPTSGH